MPVFKRSCLGALLLLGACTSSGVAHRTSAVPATATKATPTPVSSVARSTCPVAYPPPDPRRPRVSLAFRLAADLGSATGTEHIAFTPDRPITELVFRLTANTKPTVAEGNRVVVTKAVADHDAGAPVYTAANADPSTQGGLLHLPFTHPIPAGETVTADLSFRLTLGPASFDRFGRSQGFAWFGSAQPLLAWERGYGWHTEPMILFPAESATSEAMDTELSVTAPAADIVMMSGDPSRPSAVGLSRTWRAHIEAARDVSVAVGPFQTSDTMVGGVRLRVGAPNTTLVSDLVPEFRRAITALAARYGPFPFPSLSVARVPAGGGGIEYPSSILMLSGTRLVAVHETAHQWFYAMVGDSQAQHAWLDEAFAQYSEESVDGTARLSDLTRPGRVDFPTASYGTNENGYYRTTYDKGAAALFSARQAAGPAAFDAALRCYVHANAWRIVNPPDFAAALAALPKAIAVLKQAGALR